MKKLTPIPLQAASSCQRLEERGTLVLSDVSSLRPLDEAGVGEQSFE
jgi:hypothetical protein